MKSLRRWPLIALSSLVLLAIAAPCLATVKAAKPQPTKPAPAAGQAFDSLPDSKNPIDYTSPEGRFQVTFPAGCARLRTRTNVRPDMGKDVTSQIVFITCDRANAKNEGCSVSSMLGLARDLKGQAAADRVLAEVTRQLEGYGVNPISQTPMRRDFGKYGVVEGIDIQAQGANGAGDFWIRGLLAGDDIYMVMAWKAAGGLWTAPEYVRFFDSFRPWVE